MAFSATLEIVDGEARITLAGELDASVAPAFREKVEAAAAAHVGKLVIVMAELTYMASAGLRGLIFAKQKMGGAVEIVLVGLQEGVRETLEMTGFQHSVTVVDAY
jgi:anti-anti-sigma factor